MVRTIAWNQTDSFYVGTATWGQDVDLLNAYLATTIVRSKLAGYATFTANMKVTVTLSGSPFQFGKMHMTYRPGRAECNNQMGSEYRYGGYACDFAATNSEETDANRAMMYSQRQGIALYPSESSTATLIVPLIVPTDRISRDHTSVGYDRLTQFDFWSLTRLKAIGATNNTPCTIRVYVSLVDVKLGDRSALYQSANVADDLMVAMSASSTVHSNTTTMSDMLVHEAQGMKDQTAESAGLLALGAMVRATGFSNPHGSESVNATFPTGLAGLTSCDRIVTADSISVGDRATQTGGKIPKRAEDELSLDFWGGLPAIIGTATLGNDTAYGSQLININVSPFNFHSLACTANGGTAYIASSFTPAAYAALAFRYWRGDMVYTFEFVGSKMHRGQLRVFYDPMSTTTHSEGLVKSCIWDISEHTRLQVKVPYDSFMAFKKVQGSDVSFASSPIYNTNLYGTLSTYANDTHMGRLLVETHSNIISVADSDPDAMIIVTCHVENYELAKPINPEAYASSTSTAITLIPPATYQSLDVEAGSTDDFLANLSKRNPIRTYMGEQVTSLRALCHRSTPGPILTPAAYADNTQYLNSITLPVVPTAFGFEPFNGISPAYLSTGSGLVKTGSSTTTYKFNWHPTHPSTFFAAAFALKRGGYRWRFVPIVTKSMAQTPHATGITVSRPTNPPVTGSASRTSVNYNTLDTDAKIQKAQFELGTNSYGGMAVATEPTCVCDVVIPMQTAYKAEGASPLLPIQKTNAMYDDTQRTFKVSWFSASTTSYGKASMSSLKSYVAADVDFDVFYFINTPRVYTLLTLPTAT